jgi:PLP dependent protein
MNSIVVNLMQVRARIELAALAAKREPEEIELLVVSKTFPASAVEEAMHPPLAKTMCKRPLKKLRS